MLSNGYFIWDNNDEENMKKGVMRSGNTNKDEISYLTLCWQEKIP